MILIDLQFHLKQIPFLVTKIFAITMNKPQGQTFEHVDVDLTHDKYINIFTIVESYAYI